MDKAENSLTVLRQVWSGDKLKHIDGYRRMFGDGPPPAMAQLCAVQRNSSTTEPFESFLVA